MERLTRRFIIKSLDGLNLSEPIRYERYYINDNLRIQKKGERYEKEILDDGNVMLEKIQISEQEFLKLKKQSYSEIIRNGYNFLDDTRVSLREYLDKYKGLYRVEVKLNSKKEVEEYEKLDWMGAEITHSPLAFDKYLSKLSEEEFKEELKKYI